MEVNPPEHPRATSPGVWKMRARKAAIGANSAVAMVLAVLAWLMVNFLAARHHGHLDISRDQYYRLSPRTVDVLERLQRPVEAIVFFQPDSELYPDVDALLRAFTTHAPGLRLDVVDPDRDPARAKELSTRYRVEKGNAVIFTSGDRFRVVPADRIAQYEKKTLLNPSPRRLAFTAEPHFLSAILSVMEDKQPVLYSLTGHGERDFRDETKQQGYSEVARLLQMEGIDARPLDVIRSKGVPADCDVLLVAGPAQRLSTAEADYIRQYMRGSGRLFLLVDSGPACGLEDWLREWGVLLGADVVLDERKTLTGRDVYVTHYADHPATARMNGTTSIFFLPRSVDAVFGGVPSIRPEDQPRLTQLASSSEHGWAERDLKTSPAVYNEGVDKKGPVSLAVAVEKGIPSEKGASVRPGRLVVVGDSQFAANDPIYGGGLTFFMNCVNWLLDRGEMVDVPVKPIQELRLNLDRHDLTKMFVALVLGIPGWIAATGLLVWSRRRH